MLLVATTASGPFETTEVACSSTFVLLLDEAIPSIVVVTVLVSLVVFSPDMGSGSSRVRLLDAVKMDASFGSFADVTAA